jgi:large subunit ribosomal protein L13
MKTYLAKSNEVKRDCFVANADGKVLGRLATRVATILSGKHKPIYTPNVDTGDYVVIINADKVKVTGKKVSDKIYRTYSGYPGGLKELNFETLLKKKPRDIIRLAVKNMLPKNRLAKKMLRKLKLYVASEKPALPKKVKELAI